MDARKGRSDDCASADTAGELIVISVSLEKHANAPSLQRLDWQALLAPTFKTGTLLAPPNLKKLGRVLKDAAAEVDDEGEAEGPANATAGGSGTGAWKAQPHFVWDVLLDAYFADGKSKSAPGQVAFQDLFRVVVDGASPTFSLTRTLPIN